MRIAGLRFFVGKPPQNDGGADNIIIGPEGVGALFGVGGGAVIGRGFLGAGEVGVGPEFEDGLAVGGEDGDLGVGVDRAEVLAFGGDVVGGDGAFESDAVLD